MQELTEAEKLLERIKSYEERTFQCLVYYAIGKLYLRENRYAGAAVTVLSPSLPFAASTWILLFGQVCSSFGAVFRFPADVQESDNTW